MKPLRIYKYSGDGRALGCDCTVLARDKDEAEDLLEDLLSSEGLDFDRRAVADIGEFKNLPQIIHFWNGDY